MQAWTAQHALLKYQPSPADVDAGTFAARLGICQRCPLRSANRCRSAGQLLTVLARRKSTHCPKRKWHGDPAVGAIDVPIYPTDCRQADVVFFMGYKPAPGWWETKGELSVRLLSEAGITAACLVNPNDEDLPRLLTRLKSKLVLNRGFLISPEAIDRMALKLPHTKFLAMNHSSYPFLISSPWAWKRHTQFMAMAERRNNCFVGTPDERNHLAAIRPDLAEKLVWIPNGSDVPDWKARSIGSPPIISLIGAGRQLKNLPNQLAGFALAQRQREMRLFLSIRGNEWDEMLAEACGYLHITADVRPWVDWREYQERIRGVDVGLQVSFTESFNYVGLEHMLLGVPVVGSSALRFLPRGWQTDPEDPQAISEHILARLDGWEDDRLTARRMATRFAEQRNRQFQQAIADLL